MRYEANFEGLIIFNNAVVYDRESSGALGVRISDTGNSMGSPPSVSNTLTRFGIRYQFLQLSDLALSSGAFNLAGMHQSNTCRIISAILESL